MRFPRTNLTGAEDFTAGNEAEDPQEISEEAGERIPAPLWQSNFSLAPNVRFTRTPESLITRRRPPQEAAPEPVLEDPPIQEETIVTQPPIQVEKQAIQMEARGPIQIDVPFDIYLPEAEPVSHASNEPVVTESGTIVDQQLQAIAVSMLNQKSSFRAVSGLSSISDSAFWEVMAFEEERAEPIRIPSAALPPVARPKVEPALDSITARFRIVEWRPGRKAVDAVVAPIEVAPVAAPPMKSAPRPPAAAVAVEQPKPDFGRAPPIAPMPVRAPIPPVQPVFVPPDRVPQPVARAKPSANVTASGYEFPPRTLLQEPVERVGEIMSQETLEQNAGLLESVLEDFGVKGEIIHVRPGPVVTLYEFEPAPGVKSSRVIGLADDIARSMSALSARVAVVPGRNVIGIELPNATRETVYFREMIESQDFEKSGYKLALGLGKTIGGEPVIAELAKMPHLLVAGTTGSGKSVAINTMILSLLYRMTPEQCRLIMVDPKMLELSVYDGIPHLLTPVVTDPKKAVMALKWAVREMEERYRKMSRLGVRNIDGYNGRVALAREKGETIHVMVQTGFDKGTGAPIEEQQEMDLTPMPYIVVIVDEMADLMMVAGKEIEGAIQRLAQMARAAGIHLIMATQRPSVDVITGTIKANFPTRISFQVTSKIDSRTILGEQGAEQLLGQGDMLHMAGGGRISRVHGPFVSDAEVEKVVAHLKTQGRPEYLDTVTADEEEEEEAEEGGAVFDKGAIASEDGNELYEQAVKVVMRDKKCSTSYIQRRLGIGYNRAASLVERMEKEGLVGPANHVGKREIISGRSDGE
ncbi:MULTISPECIES: DNA translocase FtsK [unclassified Sinorhizobium]|uniref:DNA translocase FtsK n=1 Tax=unclassified Sinorhizobium TaxID=2613772 RepID=UPI003525CAB5